MIGQELSLGLGQRGHRSGLPLWKVNCGRLFGPVTRTLCEHSRHQAHRVVLPFLGVSLDSTPVVAGVPLARQTIRRRPRESVVSVVRPYFRVGFRAHCQIALSTDILCLHDLTGAVHRFAE